MAKFSIKIKGLDQLKKKLDTNGQKKLIQYISEEIEIAAHDIRNKAVISVPVDQGFLRNSITVDGKYLQWSVYVGAYYGAYLEFGTKTKVDVPSEMQSIANEFKSGKVGYTSFKEAISEWMKRKGIPQEALYPIMAKIFNVGITPKPFLYPAYKEGTKNLQKEIDNIINLYLNK